MDVGTDLHYGVLMIYAIDRDTADALLAPAQSYSQVQDVLDIPTIILISLPCLTQYHYASPARGAISADTYLLRRGIDSYEVDYLGSMILNINPTSTLT